MNSDSVKHQTIYLKKKLLTEKAATASFFDVNERCHENKTDESQR